MTPSDPITITLSGATLIGVVTGIGGWFANTFFAGKGKPPKTACANCPYHEDHEKRLRALEVHQAHMEAAIPAIRADIHDVKEMLNTLLLRFGAGSKHKGD